MTCPSCKSDNVYARGKRYALYPLGIVAVIGLSLTMLHQASVPREYHCEQSGLDFARRTTPARIARALLLAIIVGFIALFALLFFAVLARGI